MLSTPIQVSIKCLIKFELLQEAINYDTKLLAFFDFNMLKLITTYLNFDLSRSNEFRLINMLEPLFYLRCN